MTRLPFFSYGFRPFFFSAALFAGTAIPVWAIILSGANSAEFLYGPREWHVHEMVFGFLSAIIAGFLFTAMPNWTDRPPVKGKLLIVFWGLWLAGRLVIAKPWLPDMVCVLVDVLFLIGVAGIVWREIAIGKAWDRSPIGVLISLYALANILFHGLALSDSSTELAERMGLTIIILLLSLIGGKVTPGFTEDFLEDHNLPQRPPDFSGIDKATILLTLIAGISWIVQPLTHTTGWLLLTAGIMHLIRLSRWYGWRTWREPLVLILHVGYGWLAMALIILGAAALGVGFYLGEAIHALTTGAIGSMTLAIMTRASLGHTGRPKYAGPGTIMMYSLVNLGALLRVFGPATPIPTFFVYNFSAMAWSGGYLLFAIIYGKFLLSPSLDEE
ncbi:MAG: NnrS family protein [Candidatus Nitronauta litoralis]|uniref:NnrS family protein n=1 Tax=Candidatus Nitronauta litoralis TaxID=2705533 RepID=A0A7T0G0L6_9BACT|nr:MAG: NnrS family protein [Candidatus Nitronauta litoralis]